MIKLTEVHCFSLDLFFLLVNKIIYKSCYDIFKYLWIWLTTKKFQVPSALLSWRSSNMLNGIKYLHKSVQTYLPCLLHVNLSLNHRLGKKLSYLCLKTSMPILIILFLEKNVSFIYYSTPNKCRILKHKEAIGFWKPTMCQTLY